MAGKGYNEGYNDGYSNGLRDGEGMGHDRGYEEGWNNQQQSSMVYEKELTAEYEEVCKLAYHVVEELLANFYGSGTLQKFGVAKLWENYLGRGTAMSKHDFDLFLTQVITPHDNG